MPVGGNELTIKDDLHSIIGKERVIDDPVLLSGYGHDFSLVEPGRPDAAVSVTSTPELQEIIRYAAAHRIPVTPRSSGVGFYGAAVPARGGIVVDLTRMNKVLEVDPLDRKIKVEPGVTFHQAQEAAAAKGMMVACPLLPHPQKSLLTSSMQREPLLIPKSEYNENFLTGEIVLANGELFWLGTAMSRGMVGKSNPEAFILGTKIFRGSQGTLGIATWANIKAEPLPSMDKLFFIPVKNLSGAADVAYRIERLMIGNECLILNRRNLASILSQRGLGEMAALETALPPFCVVLVISGLKRQPLGRIAYEEEALFEAGREGGFNPTSDLGGLDKPAEVLLGLLRTSWPQDRYWKQYPKPGFAEIFFNATMDRAAEFMEAVTSTAVEHRYSPAEIGIYLQPIERGRMGFHCFTFNYDPDNASEKDKVKTLFRNASQRVIDLGGLFTNPYGIWAGMVYKRVAGFDTIIRSVKKAFDPQGILNPGKLLNN
jgi:FAD/FMN-containing dehydrogenase